MAPGCERFARRGNVTCRRHGRGRAGADLAAAVQRATRDATRALAEGKEQARQRAAAEQFRRRVERGEYRGLFDERLGRVMAEAAATRALDDELGALRYVLARLLAEEEDTGRLALGVARVSRAAARVELARRRIDRGRDDELAEALAQALMAMDG